MRKEIIIDRLKTAWIKSPYERLGQFIYNALMNGEGDFERIYYMTDDEFIKEIEEFIKKIPE